VQLSAVASRDAAKATAFAAQFGISRTFGSYESLLADDALDAVYIPLPNSLHAQWAVRAAQHGLHVLCEKPLAMNLAEARAMFDAARQHGVMLLEAYPWWFQPQTAALLGLLRGGAIGTVRLVQSTFGFTLRDPAGTNIRDALLNRVDRYQGLHLGWEIEALLFAVLAVLSIVAWRSYQKKTAKNEVLFDGVGNGQ